jgi:hypothetical protein
MNIKELEAQFAELDSLWLSSPAEIDVRLDDTGSSIVATRRNYDYGIGLPEIAGPAADTNYFCGSEPVSDAECEAYSETISLPTSGSYERVGISGQMLSPFQSGEPLTRIDVSKVEVSDEFIYKRIKLILDPSRVGHLPEVKLASIGATGIYEVIEDYSCPIEYSAIGRQIPSEVGQNYNSVDGGLPENANHLCTITVKKGFQFDRATIPRIFWVLISKDDLSNVPPLIHDLLYRFAGMLPNEEWVTPYTTFSRKEADDLFFHLMERSGVTSWRLTVAYQVVCRFSSFAWGRYLSS